MRTDLCKRSVGGVVAIILLLILFGSIFSIVARIVVSMLSPSRRPRCLQVAGVEIPISLRPSVISLSVLMHRAVVFLILIFSPLTLVNWSYSRVIGQIASALGSDSGLRLSSANIMGPMVRFPIVLYMRC